MSRAYQPRIDRVEALQRALHDALARPESEAVVALEAAGRLAAMGRGDLAASAGRSAGVDDAVLERAYASLDFSSLEDAAIELLTVLADPGAPAPERGERVRRALAERDTFELRGFGLEVLVGKAPEPNTEQLTFVLEFEQLLRPEVWKLTAFNDVRAEALADLAPARRSAFWWHAEGAGVASDATAALSAVAQLVARFPAARRELEALARAESLLASGEQPAARANDASGHVVSLAEWVARHRPRTSTAERLSVAVAPTLDQVSLVKTEACEISWREPSTVIVDLRLERRPGEVPRLALENGRTVPAEAVPRALERFRFVLDDEALQAASFTVTLPLAGGDVVIRVPPER